MPNYSKSPEALRSRARRARLREQGLCIYCELTNDRVGFAQCTACKTKNRPNQDRYNAARYDRVTEGTCTRCFKNPVEPGFRRCISCAEQRTAAERDVRHVNKLRCIATLGGECIECGLRDPVVIDLFHFHHVNPSDKDVEVATLLNCSWERIAIELAKCVLLCANCHIIWHYHLRQQQRQQRYQTETIFPEHSINEEFTHYGNVDASSQDFYREAAWPEADYQ
jgi:hypothetical protein